ncbi:MAG: aminotransferase class I/II-fold pyridoxal phosphate-dependent enzyme [Betaproteobacteria bacterium]|nr:MAG: aminotransferase class I/II-fold pyridoxal phosphate-dependent enzyme [Betaproteobacteria bacterium]
MRDISRNLLDQSASLRDALQRLNEGVYGAVFITDAKERVLGMLTDGDVRRALLAGAALTDPAVDSMNREFVKGQVGAPHAENVAKLSERVRHVPLLDPAGRLVDMLSWAEMLRIPLMQPALGGNELAYVSDCVTAGWISSQGEYVQRFESKFSDFLDGSHALAVSSGTAALHLALKALDIGRGDEVIVPDLTFAATANVVLHCGATPVLADVDQSTWTLDPNEIERRISERTRAIIPVHLYGHPCDMDQISAIAHRHGLKVIEDCAEAQGARYRGRLVGALGDIGCFSFFSNKVITTGEGGMVTTANPELADRLRLLRDHGMRRGRRYWHEIAGFNYRMTNLQAAVGVAQMERVQGFIKRRQEIGEHYIARLGTIPGLVMPPRQPWAQTIYWIFSMLVEPRAAGLSRDELATELEARGIETRPFFYPLHVQPPYAEAGEFRVSSYLSSQGISLPSGNEISAQEIDRVCDTVLAIIENREPSQ